MPPQSLTARRQLLLASRIAIVTDSTADLPEGAAERLGICTVPLVVSWDGQSFRDKVDLSTADFYARLRTSRGLPRTGAPSLAAFEEQFRGLLETHDGIVCITLAAGLSATFDVARQAAAAVSASRIRVVDSHTLTMCLGWLVEDAAEMAAAGAPIDAIVEMVEARRDSCRVYAVLDTLEFLQRGGRIGRAQALMGTLLQVKPIVEVRNADVIPLERQRTTSAAIRRVVELVARTPGVSRLAVVNGAGESAADELARQLAPRYPELRIERGEIGAVLGTHAGPGVYGVTLRQTT